MATIAQLQQELQNELTTSNQILKLISIELQQIKQFTQPGGEFESVIQQNTSLTEALARMQLADLENLPPITRAQVDVNVSEEANNLSYQQQDSFRDALNMDVSQ